MSHHPFRPTRYKAVYQRLMHHILKNRLNVLWVSAGGGSFWIYRSITDLVEVYQYYCFVHKLD